MILNKKNLKSLLFQKRRKKFHPKMKKFLRFNLTSINRCLLFRQTFTRTAKTLQMLRERNFKSKSTLQIQNYKKYLTNKPRNILKKAALINYKIHAKVIYSKTKWTSLRYLLIKTFQMYTQIFLSASRNFCPLIKLIQTTQLILITKSNLYIHYLLMILVDKEMFWSQSLILKFLRNLSIQTAVKLILKYNRNAVRMLRLVKMILIIS